MEGRLAPAKEKHTQLCVSCVSCREAGPAAARDPGGGEGGAMGRSRVVVGVGVCSKNSCRRRIYYSGPFKFLDCLLGFAFPSTRSDGPQSGDEVGFAVEAEPITGPACANGGCSAQTKPQAPSQGVTSGRRVRPAVSPVISAVSLLWNQPLHCHSAHAAHAAHASHTALHSSWREPHEPLEPLTRPAARCIAAVVLGWR